MIERFARTLSEAGGRCHVVADGREAAAVVERLVRAGAPDLSVPVALYARSEVVEATGVADGLRRRDVRLDAMEEVDRPEDYTVGLTGARWAIAETGSLVIGGRREARGGWGVASVLPRVHVAVLRGVDIRPDLAAGHAELVRRMAAGETEWLWVSGPSSTADIAKTLVRGVHGPNELHAVILTEGSGTGREISNGTVARRPK